MEICADPVQFTLYVMDGCHFKRMLAQRNKKLDPEHIYQVDCICIDHLYLYLYCIVFAL